MSKTRIKTSLPDEEGGTSAPVVTVDDDATSVSTEINDGSESFFYDPMPLLKYSRILGLPESRAIGDEGATVAVKTDALSPLCTCSAISQVLLDPTSMGNLEITSGESDPIDQEELAFLSQSDLWKQPQNIMALGFEDSNVSIISVCNGHSILSPDTKLSIRENEAENTFPVVDVHLDATGTVLAAIDAGGCCAVWDVKYSIGVQYLRQHRHAQSTPSEDNNGGGNVLSNMFSSLMGIPPQSSEEMTQQRTESDEDQQSSSPSLQLVASVGQVSVIKYPTNFATPTCLAIDPTYKKKKEKKIITGFQDGRLMLTCRGGLFQRRNDTVLYPGAPDSTSQSEKYRGIECIAWRGSFIAWADASGIKLMDVETLTRIAHIDRPLGAQPNLYPNISSLHPTLLFETSHEVLVGWGDCLMGITINEAVVPGTDTMRRSVECSMAWELDCVACGVSPLDKEHVLVLGVIPLDDEHDDEADQDQDNELELQILSRNDGGVLYSDLIPVIKPNTQAPLPGLLAESASSYKLLSSFALPRMEDSLELEELRTYSGGMEDDFDVQSLFAAVGGDVPKRTFCDSHLQWNVKSILFEEEYRDNLRDDDDDDASSIDSDDYGFILRPAKESEVDGIAANNTLPPTMVIASPNDIILAKTATIDDAITYSLSRNQNSKALNLGLRHRRQLRSYKIGDLADHYLEAVLKLHQSKEVGLEDDSDSKSVAQQLTGRRLSLRRTKLAVRSMPYLLGDRVEAWTKWAKELESIPGSIFLLREYLPVRDPILPQILYDQILERMLLESESLLQNSSGTETNVGQEAVNHFLDSLLAWGPTNTLKECIRLYKYTREHHPNNKSVQRKLRAVEVSLQRRYLQTAAEYLSFPMDWKKIEEDSLGAPRYEANKDGSKDSLFSVSNILKLLAPRVPIVALPEDYQNDTNSDTETIPTNVVLNNLVSLKSMARIRMMQNRYDLALECFLVIGLNHSTKSIEEFEALAIDIVNSSRSSSNATFSETLTGYEFVLGMIEYHHLHQLLLEKSFVSQKSNDFLPLFALLKLVGLDLMGRFLIEHCVSPEFSLIVEDETKESMQREVLPMDLVATQLEQSPALLHWYLHLVFTRKPELYVKFPNNYIPPKAVTELHRRHFELFVEFAGDTKDSAKSFSEIETYKAESKTTPLLTFLKAVLPIGGLSPLDARRTLEMQRSKDFDEDEDGGEVIVEGNSSSFCLELAYIIEHYCEETEAEAFGVLDLYLDGVKSLMLAVSYAQRQKKYSALLWDRLINYCLSNESVQSGNGTLFGALLEASALSGADLARLVARIPPGMNVEGLRPRLVAAVADYRLKLDIHEAASKAATGEKIALLREVAHRSRRGVRYQLPTSSFNFEVPKQGKIPERNDTGLQQIPAHSQRTKMRRDRHSLSYSIPIR